MTWVAVLRLIAGVGLVWLLLLAGAAQAQTETQATDDGGILAEPLPDETVAEEAQPQKKKAKTEKKAKADQSAKAAGELELRVNQLEEQVVDMQVVIGTLESLARAGGGQPAYSADTGGGVPADVDGRVRNLELQMQQLANQMSELTQQVQTLNARLGKGAAAQVPSNGTDLSLGAATIEQPAEAGATAGSDIAGFGETTVAPSGGDAIGEVLGGADNTSGGQVASLGTGDPQQDYDNAKAFLTQQDFPAAEQAFRAFIQQHPDSNLASNAQYWVGETLYVRGLYKPAAESFLKGYSDYREGQKAPDSLLKLAMSLARLGQKDAACNAFVTLDSEYPNASAQVKRRAISERERTGC